MVLEIEHRITFQLSAQDLALTPASTRRSWRWRWNARRPLHPDDRPRVTTIYDHLLAIADAQDYVAACLTLIQGAGSSTARSVLDGYRQQLLAAVAGLDRAATQRYLTTRDTGAVWSAYLRAEASFQEFHAALAARDPSVANALDDPDTAALIATLDGFPRSDPAEQKITRLSREVFVKRQQLYNAIRSRLAIH